MPNSTLKRKTPLRSRTRLRKTSPKRRKQLQAYSPQRKSYLLRFPVCAVCKKEPSSQIHHTKGRVGTILNDEAYFLAVCWKCHAKITNHGAWAKANGYKI